MRSFTRPLGTSRGPWAAGQAIFSRSGSVPGGEHPRYLRERQRRHRGPRSSPCPPSAVPLCSWCPCHVPQQMSPDLWPESAQPTPLSTLQARRGPCSGLRQRGVTQGAGRSPRAEEDMTLRGEHPPGLPARQRGGRLPVGIPQCLCGAGGPSPS